MKLRWLHGWLIGAGLAFPGVTLAQECAGGACSNETGASGSCASGSCKTHKWHLDNCSNIPKGAQPAPNGTYVNRFIETQQNKAEMDDFVIYKHMWYKGGTDLGPLGRYTLDQIVKRLPTVPFPVVIATSKDAALDESRRDHVMAMLKLRGVDDPARVIVAYPIAEGLFGDEAPRIYNGIIGVGNQGTDTFGGGGGLGGFGRLPAGGFNAFRGFGGFGGIGRP